MGVLAFKPMRPASSSAADRVDISNENTQGGNARGACWNLHIMKMQQANGLMPSSVKKIEDVLGSPRR